MELLIVKSMIEGVHLAVYSTIKPGALHKLRLDKKPENYVSNTLSIIDYLIQAVEIGEKIRRGELAATNMDLGKLLGKSLREAYRWMPRHVYPSYIVPQIIYSIALSHANIDSIVRESGKLVRSLNLFLSISNWREIRYFIDSLRSVHRDDMYEHLGSTGITHLAGIEGGVSFADIFRVLGSRWPAFTSLDLREYAVIENVKKLLEYYRKYGEANNSIIALYLEIVSNKMPQWARQIADEAVEEGLMQSREGSKKLFELDLKLRKKNISFDEYIGLLAVIVGLAVYEGLRP